MPDWPAGEKVYWQYGCINGVPHSINLIHILKEKVEANPGPFYKCVYNTACHIVYTLVVPIWKHETILLSFSYYYPEYDRVHSLSIELQRPSAFGMGGTVFCPCFLHKTTQE